MKRADGLKETNAFSGKKKGMYTKKELIPSQLILSAAVN